MATEVADSTRDKVRRVNEYNFTLGGNLITLPEKTSPQGAELVLNEIRESLDSIEINDRTEEELEQLSKFFRNKFSNYEELMKKLDDIWEFFDVELAPRPANFEEQRGYFLEFTGSKLIEARNGLKKMATGEDLAVRSFYEEHGWKNRDFERLRQFDETRFNLERLKVMNRREYFEHIFLLRQIFKNWGNVPDSDYQYYKKNHAGWNQNDFVILFEALGEVIDPQEAARSEKVIESVREEKNNFVDGIDIQLSVLDDGISMLREMQPLAGTADIDQNYKDWMPKDFDEVIDELEKLKRAERLRLQLLGEFAMGDSEKNKTVRRQIQKLFDIVHYIPTEENYAELAAINRRKAYASQVLFKLIPAALLNKTVNPDEFEGGQVIDEGEIGAIENISMRQKAPASKQLLSIFEGEEKALIRQTLNDFARLTGDKNFLETDEVRLDGELDWDELNEGNPETMSIDDIFGALEPLLEDEEKAQKMFNELRLALQFKSTKTHYEDNRKAMIVDLQDILKSPEDQRKNKLVDLLIDNDDDNENLAELMIRLYNKYTKTH